MLEIVRQEQESRQATAEPHSSQEQVTAFIRIARVKEISGFSKDTLMRWIKAGKFPRAVVQEKNKAGPKQEAGARVVTCLWDLAEVMEWRRLQFAKREQRKGTG